MVAVNIKRDIIKKDILILVLLHIEKNKNNYYFFSSHKKTTTEMVVANTVIIKNNQVNHPLINQLLYLLPNHPSYHNNPNTNVLLAT